MISEVIEKDQLYEIGKCHLSTCFSFFMIFIISRKRVKKREMILFLVIDNFLTEEECDHIIEKAKHFGLASSGLHVDESVAKYKKYTYGKNLLIGPLEMNKSIFQCISFAVHFNYPNFTSK